MSSPNAGRKPIVPEPIEPDVPTPPESDLPEPEPQGPHEPEPAQPGQPIPHGIGGCLLAALLLLASPALPGRAQGDKPLDDDYVKNVRIGLSQLSDEIERLQETLIAEKAAKQELALYRQLDGLLGEVVAFQSSLKAKPARAAIYKRFDDMDRRMHEVFKTMEALEKDKAKLQRSLQYLRAADDYLHFVVSAGDLSDARKKQILERQTRAMAISLKELVKTASFVLAEAAGREVLISDLKNMLEAAEAFEKNAGGSDVADRFKIVNQAWEKVARGLSKLPPGENVYLLRSAVRLDQLHERLFTLLAIKGERPRFSIPT